MIHYNELVRGKTYYINPYNCSDNFEGMIFYDLDYRYQNITKKIDVMFIYKNLCYIFHEDDYYYDRH